jgi:predicted alpha/beta superfamily hydrolase
MDATVTKSIFFRVLLHVCLVTWTLLGSLAVCLAADKSDPFAIGEQLHMQSKVLAEGRTYVVHVPRAYRNSKGDYPVLVVLDAEVHFALTTAAVDELSGSGRIPPLIVVGVTNTDRERDMTPSVPKTNSDGAPWTGPAGGADKFLSFIADELLPTIDHNYRTRRYRVLAGHSLGGLFAVYALTNRPDVFNGYLAISPSLWWDDQALVKKSQSFFAAHRNLSADLYMAIGSEGQQMLGGAYKLAALLEESKLTELRWQFKRSPEQDHGTITYPATYEGLQGIFSGYRIADPVALFEQGGLAAFERHYAGVSKRLGYTVDVPFETYAGMMRELSSRGRFAEALEIGRKMLDLNPKNPLTLSMLAQVASMQKDDARAIEYLTQVLKLFPGDVRARVALGNYKVDVDELVRSPRLSAKDVQPYLGKYHSVDEQLKVEYQNGKLTAQSSNERCELRPITQTRFYCLDADVDFEFGRGDRDSTIDLRIEHPDRVEEYRKVR